MSVSTDGCTYETVDGLRTYNFWTYLDKGVQGIFNRIIDNEFHMPVEERYPEELNCYSEKPTNKSKEFSTSVEVNIPDDEFNNKYTQGREEKKPDRSKQIKRILFAPVAASIAVVSIVFSSLGYDPLGKDAFNSDTTVSDINDGNGDGLNTPEYDDPSAVFEDAYIHVTYVPAGNEYTSYATGSEGLEEAKVWVVSQGGNPDTMKYISTDITPLVEYSDDAIVVGDPDDPYNSYVAQGTVNRTERYVAYYEAYAMEDDNSPDNITPTGVADTEFPVLPNLEPDFAGEYAWSGLGSEEYIMFWSLAKDPREYLHMGTFFASTGSYDANGNFIPNQVTTMPDAWYDISTNTLTLDNFTGEVLEVNLMGNGFTINLIGENHLDELIMWGAGYGGSVTFTGTGSLTLNEDRCAPDDVGILVHGENSASCVMIDKEVTLELYGAYAILIDSVTIEKAIYYLEPSKLTGGERICLSSEEPHRYTIIDEDGNPSHYVKFAP